MTRIEPCSRALRNVSRPAALGLVGLVVLGCGESTPDGSPSGAAEQSPATLAVHTASYPLEYFAQQIGGDRVDVRFPAPEGTDPAAWSPSPEAILAFQNADLILLSGAEYEGWVATATLPATK